jgi:hypothetical protein
MTGKSEMAQDFTDMLVSYFPTFLEAFDEYCPFKRYGQLKYHAETIGRLRELGSPAAALNDQVFLESLYRTLQAWGLGARASKLKPFPTFVSALQAKASEITELGGVLIPQTEPPTTAIREAKGGKAEEKPVKQVELEALLAAPEGFGYDVRIRSQLSRPPVAGSSLASLKA